MEKETTNQTSPILVTGMHRSGTTWVGKMIAASSEIAYISEPLNVLHRPGVMRVPTPYWYTYINKRNEHDFLAAFRETINFKYHILKELRSLHSSKDILRMGRDWNTFLQGRILKQRVLIKDPFAIFSAPWFEKRLNCKVIITVRHPAAITSSLIRLGWSFDFTNLLAQKNLMQDWLEIHREELESMIKKPDDKIGQACLLWKLIYKIVSDFQETLPVFRIVRHEDLSKDPVHGFHDLYQYLDLNFSQHIKKTILESSSTDNPKQLAKKNVHSIRLDSQANLMNWKNLLDQEEITRIRHLTDDTATQYYSDEDW